MYEIDRRENLHIYQARPWRAPGQAVCGTTPKASSLVDFDSVSVNYGQVSYRGKVYQNAPHGVATHQGETRKVCVLCCNGGDMGDDS